MSFAHYTGTVVYIVMYNIRYDYCWEMDDGVSTQGIRNDFAVGRGVLIQMTMNIQGFASMCVCVVILFFQFLFVPFSLLLYYLCDDVD